MPAEPEGTSEEGNGTNEGPFRQWLRFWIDAALKLTVPLGAIAGVLLARSFDMQQSIRQIANQREQSESSLRATMFGNLIGPIVGPPKAGQTVDPVRYALMVQLLALNFHEHFEFRPLMEHADQLLAKSTLADKAERRLALRTVAHRIIDRQIASLWEDRVPECTPRGLSQVTFWLFSKDQTEDFVQSHSGEGQLLWFNRPSQGIKVTVDAPNCKDTLAITFSEPDWLNSKVDVGIQRTDPHRAEAKPWYVRLWRRFAGIQRPDLQRAQAQGLQSGVNGRDGANSSGTEDDFLFTLSSFSFPFTDNTPLIDGNRFALFIRDENSGRPDRRGQFMWKVQLRWFPERYYAVTERPVDYEAVRNALNIVPSQGVKR